MFAMTRVAMGVRQAPAFELIGIAQANSTSITLPVGVKVGDLVVVYAALANDSDRTANQSATVASSGYTLLSRITHNQFSQALYVKTLTSVETTVDLSGRTAGFAFVFRGAASTPLWAIQGETFGGVNTPEVTPLKNGSIVFTMGVSSRLNDVGQFSSPPSGYGNSSVITGALGAGIWFPRIAQARKNWLTGAEDPGAWTYSGASTMFSAGYTLVVSPP